MNNYNQGLMFFLSNTGKLMWYDVRKIIFQFFSPTIGLILMVSLDRKGRSIRNCLTNTQFLYALKKITEES